MVIAILLLDATMLPSIGLGGKDLLFARSTCTDGVLDDCSHRTR